jgi:hypothetical protein
LFIGQILVIIVAIIFSAKYFRELPFILASLAVATSFITNPAFQIFGLFPTDYFILVTALIASFIVIARGQKTTAWLLLLFLGVVASHSIIAFAAYDLGDQSLMFQRVILVGRPIAVLLGLTLFFQCLRRRPNLIAIFKMLLYSILLISSLVYLVQKAIHSGGITPFGTFLSAGFGGGFRFGGLANEGGHLSKIIFPLIITAIILRRTVNEFFILCFVIAVFTLNASASGFAFGFCYIGFAILFAAGRLVYHRRWTSVLAALISGSIVGAALLAMFWSNPVLSGLWAKISNSVEVMFDPARDIYGRSPVSSLKILREFSFGVGYAGSTQRNLAAKSVGVPYGESNLGFNVLFESLSILAFIPILFYLFIAVKISHRALADHNLKLSRAALIGAVPWTIFAILFIDVLFALPQIWALLGLVMMQLGMLTDASNSIECFGNRGHQGDLSVQPKSVALDQNS